VVHESFLRKTHQNKRRHRQTRTIAKTIATIVRARAPCRSAMLRAARARLSSPRPRTSRPFVTLKKDQRAERDDREDHCLVTAITKSPRCRA
jgi:hypothetical protein